MIRMIGWILRAMDHLMVSWMPLPQCVRRRMVRERGLVREVVVSLLLLLLPREMAWTKMRSNR